MRKSLSSSAYTGKKPTVHLTVGFFVLFLNVFLLFISIRVIALPSPGIFAHFSDSIFRFPAKLFLRLSGIRIAGRNISRPSVLYQIRNLYSCSLFKVLYNIQHAISASGSEIVNAKSRFLLNFLQRLHMSFRQIYHVDIIPDSRSVVRIIIVTEYAQLFQLSDRHQSDIWHQIVRNAIRILTDRAALMRSDRIKIPQKDHIPFRIRFLHIDRKSVV